VSWTRRSSPTARCNASSSCRCGTGRIKNTINRGGEKISPEHVEVGGEDSEAVGTRTVFNQS